LALSERNEPGLNLLSVVIMLFRLLVSK